MPIALFDLDGTLVDSNYHQALAWARAFARFDLYPGLWRIHRGLGMGGDQFVGYLCGDAVEAAHGDELRDWWAQEFELVIDEVVPVHGAHNILAALADDGWAVVLASSSPKDIVERYADLLHARGIVRGWTCADDAEQTKPEPDLIDAALDLVSDETDRRAIMIGDAPWDVIAAAKAGVPTIAVRAGGYGADELAEAGAVAVLESLGELPAAMQRALDAWAADA